MWIDMEREEQQRTGATRSAANSPAATLEEDEDATDADGQDATDAGQSVVERLALRAWSPRTPHLRHRLLTLCRVPRQFWRVSASMFTRMHACMHTNIHAYMHTYILPQAHTNGGPGSCALVACDGACCHTTAALPMHAHSAWS